MVCGKFGHGVANCLYRFDKSYMDGPPRISKSSDPNYTAYLASPNTIYDLTWYIDNGASSHVIYNDQQRQNLVEHGGKQMVAVSNGEKLNIQFVDSATIHTN